MKIAVDVKGTIEGPKQKQILALIHALKDKGHDIIVWSSVFSYAANAINDHKLDFANPESKTDKWSTTPEYYYDVAIDDDRDSQYLAANKLVLVDELCDDVDININLVERIKQ